MGKALRQTFPLLVRAAPGVPAEVALMNNRVDEVSEKHACKGDHGSELRLADLNEGDAGARASEGPPGFKKSTSDDGSLVNLTAWPSGACRSRDDFPGDEEHARTRQALFCHTGVPRDATGTTHC